jgi:hypothetical protein
MNEVARIASQRKRQDEIAKNFMLVVYHCTTRATVQIQQSTTYICNDVHLST